MDYCLHVDDVPADGETRRLFDAGRGCSCFSQRVLGFEAERAADRVDTESDEVLYVLDGYGTATIEGARHELGPGSAVFLRRGCTWTLEAPSTLTALSVLVHDPDPAEASHAVTAIDREPTHGATAGRQFALGLGPELGCASVTQFVGFIPPGRAPDHFHGYDEVIYVLDGEGVLHVGDERAPLRRGSAIHLPSRLVHCVENSGTDELHVLGVFRPAGSPAEAYYPDGTLARVPQEAA